MKKSLELKETRSTYVSQLEDVHALATSEKRELTKVEGKNIDAIIAKIDALDIDIERSEKMETELRNAAKVSGASISNKNSGAKDWSLFKAIRDIQSNGRLSGLEAEMHQEAEKEARKTLQGIGLPTFMTEKRAIDQTNSQIAPKNVMAYVQALQDGGLYLKVGATNLGTVAADTVVPVTGGSTVGWNTEVAAAADGGANFTKVTLTPKRLTGYADISNVILAQNGQSAEAAVLADLGRNMAKQIDAAMFGSTSVANAPVSIAATTGVLTFTESTTAGGAGACLDMLTAIQTIAASHGLEGNLAFVNDWTLYKALKGGAQVSNITPMMVGDILAGYPAHFSFAPANVAGTSGDGLFGDFSKVFFAQFGPSNILVDPYSAALTNEVRLVMNNHFDWGVSQGKAFVKYTSLV
jgi:HK97 family phage major capsid protein